LGSVLRGFVVAFVFVGEARSAGRVSFYWWSLIDQSSDVLCVVEKVFSLPEITGGLPS